MMTPTLETKAAAPRARPGKHLTFRLGEETYGVAIHQVGKITAMTAITPVPNTPRFLRGVINLHGRIITVVDLRLKFGMTPREDSRDTCIVVMEVSGGAGSAGKMQMGVIVDAVCDVVNISAAEIEPPPSFGVSVNTAYLLGVGTARNKSTVTLLLDIEKVLSEQELAAVEQAREAVTRDA